MDVGQMIGDEVNLICEPVLRYMMRTAAAHELEQDYEEAANRLSRFGVFTQQQIDDLAMVSIPVEHYTQKFYFASGMMNAFKMYLGHPLPNPDVVDEETLMDSVRLYGQDEYKRLIDENRIDCQTIYGSKADLPEHIDDAVDVYHCTFFAWRRSRKSTNLSSASNAASACASALTRGSKRTSDICKRSIGGWTRRTISAGMPDGRGQGTFAAPYGWLISENLLREGLPENYRQPFAL